MPSKSAFKSFLVLFLLYLLFSSTGNCEENQKPKIMTKDEIIRALGGGGDGGMHLMGAGRPTRLVFGTDAGGGVGLMGSIPFEYNRYDISKAAVPQLDELGKALCSPGLSKYLFEISGHTDIRGSAQYNMRLSVKRAEEVKNYLVQHFHIPSGNLRATGCGKTRLLVEGDSEAANARNRRVEIEKIGPAKVPEVAAASRFRHRPAGPGLVAQVLYLDGKSGRMKEIGPHGNTILRTGVNPYQVYYRASRPCYVYVLQKSSDGSWQVLFPRKGSGFAGNPVRPGKDYWLPGYNTGFQLDKKTGVETIYVLASPTGVPDLESTHVPMKTVQAYLPSDAHKVTTMGIKGVGKLKTDAEPPVSLNFREIIDNAANSGAALNRITFIHQ